ncbi:hypothetical protein DYBT9623_00680 [Dyadobacter sp. CECT 9623]|uniref:Uncharacterized protein n=1 Tax=Dyadobacter linearis TaxID=2823330 RepID=A0ABM8UKK2_9BACT|nr:hypothetical protein [Dyadobacter sp. CECT 9623]CAG5067952.1 hypothetical protein DYBT9623_00680 [Dyadobacter sp. CECT 9623]
MDTSERAALKYAESLSRDEIHRRDLTAAFIAGTVYAQKNGSWGEGMSIEVIVDEDGKLIAKMKVKGVVGTGNNLREVLDSLATAYETMSKL